MRDYPFAEWHRPPGREADLGYLHATWDRTAFQVHAETNQQLFHAEGPGVFLGRAWSIATDEPYFDDFHCVMEGNNGYRLNGGSDPVADCLGTADSFGFNWDFGANSTGSTTASTMCIGRSRRR